ncbi:MAG: type III-B CRISPR module-associated protein Cmr3 [Actinomycetia bacterium]|nr:type III-B CRISPR module-associated protein Cmr3 [Actinomycetes bacterium]
MTTLTLRVDALTPLLFRDARPFTGADDETRAHSLDLPGPSTVMGLIRTVIGDTLGWTWDGAHAQAAKTIRCHGLWFTRGPDGSSPIVLPAPADAVPLPVDASRAACRPKALRPDPFTPDVPMPEVGLLPVAVSWDEKPLSGYRFWSWPDVRAWLMGQDIAHLTRVPPPPTDERVHVGLTSGTKTAALGKLFTTEFRAWEDGDNVPREPGEPDRTHARWALFVRVEVPGDLPGFDCGALTGLRTVGHFGGERRPVTVTSLGAGGEAEPVLTPDLVTAVTSANRVALRLVTPGLFSGGWKPGWIEGRTVANPPSHLAALNGARLVAAVVNRPETVAGWDYDNTKRRPKATRWAAPAGSTYFFELPQPLVEPRLNALWLAPVSDGEHDRIDGYGLSLWGVWNYASKEAE